MSEENKKNGSLFKDKETNTSFSDFIKTNEFKQKYLENKLIKNLNLSEEEIKANIFKIICQVEEEEKCSLIKDKCYFSSGMHKILYRNDEGKISEKMVKCSKNNDLDWIVDHFPKYQKNSIKIKKSNIEKNEQINKIWKQMLEQYKNGKFSSLCVSGPESIFFELWIYYSLTLVQKYDIARVDVAILYNEYKNNINENKEYLKKLKDDLENVSILFVNFDFLEFTDSSFIQEFFLPIIRSRYSSDDKNKPIIYHFSQPINEILAYLKKKYFDIRSLFISLFDWIEKK